MNRGVADQEKEVGKKGPDPGLVTSSSNSGAEGQGYPEEVGRDRVGGEWAEKVGLRRGKKERKGTMNRGERRMRIKPVI